jgi:Prolipoprotein diacylglyceryltransferase
MNPTMIQIGPLRIQWYGFLLTLAIFIGFELAKRRLKVWGFDPEKFETVAFFAVVFGVVGARLGYVLTSPGYFLENPVEILYIWHGGLSFHGAILGGALVFLYYYKKKGHPLWPYLDAATPGVALGIIAGRIGNLMNGSDTVGRLTTLPIGFTWPEWAKGFPGICPGIDDISQSTGARSFSGARSTSPRSTGPWWGSSSCPFPSTGFGKALLRLRLLAVPPLV